MYSQFEIAVPLAFRTDFSPGKDAKEDSDISYGFPTLLGETQPTGFSSITRLNTNLILSQEGRIWRINNNSGRLFEGSIQNIKEINNQWTNHQWIDTHFGGNRAD